MRALFGAPPSLLGGHGDGVPGSRVVLALLVGAAAVAGVVVLVAVVATRGSDGEPEVAPQEAALRDTVGQYVDALNDRDAGRMLPLLTDQGLRRQLRVSDQVELPARLAELTDADRIDELRVTSVKISGDRAVVTTRFQWHDQYQEAVYRLVRRDGRWLIDG